MFPSADRNPLGIPPPGKPQVYKSGFLTDGSAAANVNPALVLGPIRVDTLSMLPNRCWQHFPFSSVTCLRSHTGYSPTPRSFSSSTPPPLLSTPLLLLVDAYRIPLPSGPPNDEIGMVPPPGVPPSVIAERERLKRLAEQQAKERAKERARAAAEERATVCWSVLGGGLSGLILFGLCGGRVWVFSVFGYFVALVLFLR